MILGECFPKPYLEAQPVTGWMNRNPLCGPKVRANTSPVRLRAEGPRTGRDTVIPPPIRGPKVRANHFRVSREC
jgi:hypothetical protein